MFGRFHRHRKLEEAIEELSEDISAIRMTLASIQAKLAVNVRENRKRELSSKLSPKDKAEIAALEAQMGGKVVAIMDENQQVLPMEDEE